MGTDLVAINLQRGRDHGLPSYDHFRRVCNVGDASSFADLRSNIKPEVNDFLYFIIFFLHRKFTVTFKRSTSRPTKVQSPLSFLWIYVLFIQLEGHLAMKQFERGGVRRKVKKRLLNDSNNLEASDLGFSSIISLFTGNSIQIWLFGITC